VAECVRRFHRGAGAAGARAEAAAAGSLGGELPREPGPHHHELWTAKEDFYAAVDGAAATVKKGSTVADGSPFLTENAQHFEAKR